MCTTVDLRILAIRKFPIDIMSGLNDFTVNKGKCIESILNKSQPECLLILCVKKIHINTKFLYVCIFNLNCDIYNCGVSQNMKGCQ